MRPAENIVVSIAELRRIAPDFKPAATIVTTSNAATLQEDINTPQTIELPSQADDLDGDYYLLETLLWLDDRAAKPNVTRSQTPQ